MADSPKKTFEDGLTQSTGLTQSQLRGVLLDFNRESVVVRSAQQGVTRTDAPEVKTREVRLDPVKFQFQDSGKTAAGGPAVQKPVTGYTGDFDTFVDGSLRVARFVDGILTELI